MGAEDVSQKDLTGQLAPMLKSAFSKLMHSRIKMSPVHATRMSSIGHPCPRFLVYEQTHHEKRQAHNEDLQALFDLGNMVESYVIRMLEDMGFEVHERNRSYHDRQHQMSGHLDGRLFRRGWARSIPIEIKGLNPFSAEKISVIDDIRHSRQAWIRKYYGQLQGYQYLGDDELGLFVLLNKSTGKLEFIESPRDPVYGAELLKKADLVREAVLANTLPDRVRSADCSRCPFVHVCLPDKDLGPGMTIIDDVELQEAIRVREENREARSRFEAADRTIKAMLPDEPVEVMCGPYLFIGTRHERKGYAVAPTSYVTWEVKQVGETPKEPPVLDPFTGPRYGATLQLVKPTEVSVKLPAPKLPAPPEDDEFDFT